MKKMYYIAAMLLCMILMLSVFSTASATTKVELEITLNGSETVKMVTPGVVFSVVKSDGQDVTVENADLEWETEVSQAKRVAVISAPRSGRSVVMSRPKGSAHTLGRISSGKIVLVLKKAIGKYTGVLYNGKLGYVLTSTIKYVDASKGVTKGEVVWTDGTSNGRKTVNLREKTTRNSRKLAGIKTGTEVTIYGTDGKWTEVDANGWHGYIQTQYIAVTDETLTFPAAEAEPTATPIPVQEEEILTPEPAEAETAADEGVEMTPEEEAEAEPGAYDDSEENPDDLDELEDEEEAFDEEEDEGWDEGL